MKFLLIAVAILVVAAGGAIWGGVYNISALEPHWEPTLQILALVRDRSIVAHSSDVKLPPTNEKLLAEGGSEYQHMCRVCHGAPGTSPEVIAQGLYPAPADLLSGHIQKKWNDGQLYWIVENGIKLTGMPAFGFTHEKDELMAVVSFVKRLPGMTLEEYRKIAGEVHEEEGHHH